LRGRLTSDVVEEEIENVEARTALDTLGMRNDMRMILDSSLFVRCMHDGRDADSII
jgi:hypothetical protein